MADPGIVPVVEDDGTIVISDPRTIRALAHPARIAVLERLFAGAVLTATECARVADLTPSAMSYHLRALEKYGLVGRADPTDDGRERPWRALGTSLQVSAETTLAGRAAEQAITGQMVEQLRTELRRTLDRRDTTADDGRREPVQFLLTPLRVTTEEARELNAAVREVLERFDGRTPPDDARVFHFWWASLPAEEPSPAAEES